MTQTPIAQNDLLLDNPHLQTVWDALHEYRETIPDEINDEPMQCNVEVWEDITHAMACITADLQQRSELMDQAEEDAKTRHQLQEDLGRANDMVAKLSAALHQLEVAANTVTGCYERNPGNFAAALRNLEDSAAMARRVISELRPPV